MGQSLIADTMLTNSTPDQKKKRHAVPVVLDLVHDASGKPYIAEIGRFDHSAFTGYEAVTGIDPSSVSYRKRWRADYAFIHDEIPPSSTLDMAMGNKCIWSLHTKHAPEISPKTINVMIGRRSGTEITDEILTDPQFADDTHFVLKNPTHAAGEGVFIVDRRQLAMLMELFSEAENRKDQILGAIDKKFPNRFGVERSKILAFAEEAVLEEGGHLAQLYTQLREEGVINQSQLYSWYLSRENRPAGLTEVMRGDTRAVIKGPPHTIEVQSLKVGPAISIKHSYENAGLAAKSQDEEPRVYATRILVLIECEEGVPVGITTELGYKKFSPSPYKGGTTRSELVSSAKFPGATSQAELQAIHDAIAPGLLKIAQRMYQNDADPGLFIKEALAEGGMAGRQLSYDLAAYLLNTPPTWQPEFGNMGVHTTELAKIDKNLPPESKAYQLGVLRNMFGRACVRARADTTVTNHVLQNLDELWKRNDVSDDIINTGLGLFHEILCKGHLTKLGDARHPFTADQVRKMIEMSLRYVDEHNPPEIRRQAINVLSRAIDQFDDPRDAGVDLKVLARHVPTMLRDRDYTKISGCAALKVLEAICEDAAVPMSTFKEHRATILHTLYASDAEGQYPKLKAWYKPTPEEKVWLDFAQNVLPLQKAEGHAVKGAAATKKEYLMPKRI